MSGTGPWRLIDTGLRPAAENFALDRALLESRRAGESPCTLRFLRFQSSALLGFHQSAEQELDLDYCIGRGITVQRRLTGGGAIVMGPGQVGWELYLLRSDLGTADMAAIARRICEAAARGISALGVEARFRPRNDIEVGGRKISGTGGAFDGDALMYQGTLLVEFDVEHMLRCLRIPAEKLSDKAIASARERVTSLRELLPAVPSPEAIRAAIADAFAAEFGIRFEARDLVPAEKARYREALAEIDTPDWVHMIRRPVSEAPIREAVRKFPGGLLRAAIALDRPAGRLKQVWFTGDFFVNPARAIQDLEAALKDVPLDGLGPAVERFFAGRGVEMLGLQPSDFAAVAREAAGAAARGASAN